MRQRRAAMSMAIWSAKAGTTTITLFSICFQTVRPPIYLFELLTQAVPTWEDAVYPVAIQPRDQADAARTRMPAPRDLLM